MELDPGVIASALITVAAGIGAVASYLNKRARTTRRELRRTREGLELFAGWAHRARMHAEDHGVTLPAYPTRLRRLIRTDEEDEDDDEA